MAKADSSAGRLGVYVENSYLVAVTPSGERVQGHHAAYAFTMFACQVAAHFDSLTFFGRARREGDDSGHHPLPKGVRLVELPHYESLTHLGQLARALLGAARSCWRGLRDVDVVWVLGPHPFSFLVLTLALVRRKRVVLGVRQDTRRYYRSRLRSRRWTAALPLVWLMDSAYRLLSSRLPTTVVGAQLAKRYGGHRAPVLPMMVSLIPSADVPATPPARNYEREVELLSVGRIEPEKAPFLLVDAFVELERRHPGRFRLTWAGDGMLQAEVRERLAALAVSDRVQLLGFVPFGPDLLALYRRAGVFVHVALTEGAPQAVIEAIATGTPVVATDVGGVRALLEDGAAGMLVPARNRDALVDAILRIMDDDTHREQLVARGLEVARATAADVQAERVARFIAG
jgi:glycosyltransferase involved in cell wall biosynthesis